MSTLKKTLGVGIITILLTFASQGAEAQEWTSFVLHVRQGTVSGPVVGGRCKGETQEGVVRTVGCARRKASVEGAWLDGECWITVRDWDGPLDAHIILENWGHELGHCVEGAFHD